MIIYLTEQGTQVNLKQGRIIINGKDGLERSIPKEQIDIVYAFGSINFSADTIKHFLIRNIPLSFFSKTGKYYGKLVNSSYGNIDRLKKQIKTTEDDEFAFSLSKIIVLAKINNQLTILRRNKDKEDINNEINSILAIRRGLEKARTINELIGYEGSISRYYFSALAKIIPEEFLFKNRNRRPPKDPFNSLISLGYSILLNEISGQIEANGLNPYAGYLHQDKNKHPSLASDLLEEYRSAIIDSLAIKLCHNKFTVEDFYFENEGCFLKDETLKIYLSEIEKVMARKQNYRKDEKASTFRITIGLQVMDLVKAIEESRPENYRPLWLK